MMRTYRYAAGAIMFGLALAISSAVVWTQRPGVRTLSEQDMLDMMQGSSIQASRSSNTEPMLKTVRDAYAESLLSGLDADHLTDHFDGSDIQPSVRAAGIPAVSPEVDMVKYLFVHHTPADTMDKISLTDLGRLVAAIASVSYVVADMPQTLDRATPGGGR